MAGRGYTGQVGHGMASATVQLFGADASLRYHCPPPPAHEHPSITDAASQITILDVTNGTTLKQIVGHAGGVGAVQLTPTNHVLSVSDRLHPFTFLVYQLFTMRVPCRPTLAPHLSLAQPHIGIRFHCVPPAPRGVVCASPVFV